MEDEDDILSIINGVSTVEPEEEEEDVLSFINTPDPVVGKDDISFDIFNNAGQGMFDSAEEDLEEELSAMYPHLKFDTPIMQGGYATDELDVTAPNGEVFRWKMNTDFNAEKNKIPTEDRDAYGKQTYIDFIKFANKHKFDEEGNYNAAAGARKTLGPDYLVTDANGNEIEMPVTKGITQKAIQILNQDPSVNTMDEAIKAAVDTDFGQMNIAWEKDLYNKKTKETVELNKKINDLVSMDGFNPNVTGDLTDAGGRTPNKDFAKTVDILKQLGMPDAVTDIPAEDSRRMRDLADYGRSNQAPAMARFNAGEPGGSAGITGFSNILDAFAVTDQDKIRENVRAWLAGSQEFGANTMGEKIVSMYENAIDTKAKELEFSKEEEKVQKENPSLKLDEIKEKANNNIQEKLDKDAKELLKVDKANWRLDDKQWEELYQLVDAARNGNDPQNKFLTKIRDLIGNDKINLLRTGDGTFIDPTLNKQVIGARNANKKLGEELEQLIFQSPDELNNKLYDYNTQLKRLASDIVRQGYGATLVEGSIPQMIGEGLSIVGGFASVGTTKGFPGSAKRDFENLEKWIETGEMPYNLTPLPEATGSWDPENKGRNTLIDKYNRLLEKRSVLLLSKELNINPITMGKADTAIGRFLDAVVEATPEAVGADSYVGDRKTRQIGMDMLEEVYGIERTKDQEKLVNVLSTSEKAGDMIPGLFRMGGEIALTTALTGGFGAGPSIVRNGTMFFAKQLLRAGVSKSLIKPMTGYSRAVLTEYIGLLGSNAMEQKLDFGPGIENPGLFALTASGIRLSGAQMSNKFNNALITAANKPGNEGLKNAMKYIYQVPVTASTEGGALKFSERVLQSASRQGIKASKIVGGAGIGAVTIKTAEELPKVLMGEESFKTAMENIANPDELMALAAGLLTMQGARPDRYVKEAVNNFYTEIDLLRGNNPKWNQLRASLGMKRVSPQKGKEDYSAPDFSRRVDDALKTKIDEINNSNKPEAQKQQEIKTLEFNANRLKLKPAMDIIAENYKETGLGDYSELETAAFNISQGGITAKNLMTIQGAGITSGGTSPILELKANGYTEKQAQSILDFANSLYSDGMVMFNGNITGKNFLDYANEAIKVNQLKSQQENIKQKHSDGKMSDSRFEYENKIIENQLKLSESKQQKSLEAQEILRAETEAVDIQKLKDAGLNVKEMNDAEMKKFMEENDGNFSETGFGYQGVVNGEPIALVNTEATKRSGRAGTETHEAWHFGFETRVGDQAIEARARVIAKDTRDIDAAREQAQKEADDYVKDFAEGLKEKGLFEVVENEMMQRPVYNIFKNLMDGENVPRSEMKEFLNEFIQLDKTGAFDNIKSKAQVKQATAQEGKEITRQEYDKAMNDPKSFIDFVLSGKYKSKNINDFLVEEQNVLKELSKGEAKTNMQASERKVVDKAPAEYQDITKDGVTVKADQVEKMVNKVANRAWSKLGSKISKDKLANSPLKNRQTWLATAKTDLKLIAEKWDPAKAEFDRYMANTGMQRMQGFSRNMGVAGKEAPTTKRIGEKVGGEEGREFDVADPDAQRAVESAGESKSSQPVETDRQVSQFEGKEAKSKQKEILEIFEPVRNNPAELAKRSEKGLAGTPRNEVGKVAELLFDAAGDRIVNPSKNPTFSKKLINAKGEVIPKGSKEKGIGFSDSEFGNIQKYFSDNANLNRFLKTMMKYSFVPNQARINNKGEVIDISKDVRGRGLGLPKRFVDYFFETFKDPTGELLSPSGRTKGTKVQLQPGQAKRLKSKFVNPTPETLEQIKKDLLIGEDIANYDRTVHGQFAKGMATVEALKTANEATRKGLPAETPAEKQLMANVRGGTSDFAASERIEKKFTGIATDPIGNFAKSAAAILKKAGIERLKFGNKEGVHDPETERVMKKFTEEIMPKYFPMRKIAGSGALVNNSKGVGMSMTGDNRTVSVRKGRSNESHGLSETQVKQLEQFATNMGSVWNKVTSGNVKALESADFIKNMKDNYKGLDLFIDQMQKMIKAEKYNPEVLQGMEAYFRTSSASSSHPLRMASYGQGYEINWKSNKGPEREHVIPANQLGEIIFRTLLDPKANVKNLKKLIKENYFQILINKYNDGKLRAAGLGSTMPEGYWESWQEAIKTGDFSIAQKAWVRYFNPKVNAQAAKVNGVTTYGFNPNEIILLNKKGKLESLADQLQIGKKEFGRDVLNPEVIAKQQNLIYEWARRTDGFKDTNQLREKMAIELDMLNAKRDATLKTMKDIAEVKDPIFNMSERMTNKMVVDEANKFDKALSNARKFDKPVKKIRVFDFDDTVGTSKNKVFAEKDGKKITLNAEEFAKKGLDLIEKGWQMDFSDFNKVTEGGKGPLFDLMKTMKEAKGERDIFILTARAPEAAPAIQKFLKEMGIDLPLKNITGLGNSTGKAKADWIVGKAAEGYNDFYFADDAPQNVKAVRDALEMIDVKSQVQQARMNASERLSEDFNKIIEEKTGIGREKVFSDVKAELRGAKARRQRFFIPPSAEDFLGLIYTTLPKGKKGEAALDFYQKNVFDPYTRAMENLSSSRVNLMADFKALKKELDVPADLRKTTKSGFTNEQAVRVYMWGKEGKEVPGLSKTDLKELTNLIENNPKLKAFADQIFELTKGDGYNTPGKDWAIGTITTDLIEVLNKTKRSKFLEPWKQNVDIIFSKENLNKLEAAFGKKYREAVENSLARMTSGSNRSGGTNRLSNQVLDYINNSTGAIMFFNTRSAVLQTLSAANFINWSFNNPLKAGKAFANQPQYWKDFTKLMNSEYLLDRRNGLKLNINESEIADAAKTSKNKAKAALNYILEKGYLPTKYADSFAIASGGATFYRNRINDLVKKGMDVKEAEAQAMKEFRQVSELSQQSSDPSRISQQQASDLGRMVLQFVNTPMQYARIQKRAVQDLVNGRGDAKTHISKIAYYGFLQNLMFNALQQGLFALGFDGTFTDQEEERKTVDTINGMLDSSLRGIGFAGVTVSVLKNLGLDIFRRSQRSRPEYVDAYYKLLEFSPAIKSKLSKIRSAAYPFDSKKRRKEVFDKGFSLDNPAYESLAKVITAVTNVPLDRAYLKAENLKHAFDDETETWMAIASFLGWPQWQLMSKATKKQGKKKKPKLEYNKSSKAFEDVTDDKYSAIIDD